MSRRGWAMALVLAPIGWGAGQPHSGSPPAADGGPYAEEACFQSSEIRDFDTVSDTFVLLESIRREVFLLTMFEGCLGLRTSIEIGLVSNLERVCSISNAAIRYRGSSGPDSCPIVKVESVEDRDAGKTLAAMRSNDRSNDQEPP